MFSVKKMLSSSLPALLPPALLLTPPLLLPL
jgi:hypothetical protein